MPLSQMFPNVLQHFDLPDATENLVGQKKLTEN